MTDLRDAARQALEALEEATNYTGCEAWSPSMTDECLAVAVALRAALEQPEQDVPETDCGNMQVEWADIPKEFNDWWDADRLTQTNPFREDSPAYWAWEGWQARTALEQPEQDWEDLYRKEKARADMWRDKYESMAGPDERVYPQQEQEQEPVPKSTWQKLYEAAIDQRNEAVAELRRLHAENVLLHERHHFDNGVLAELLQALKEATDAIEHWGSYSSDYFQQKWDLQSDINAARAAIARAEVQV